MAAALNRSALRAAAKAAGYEDLRQLPISKYRALCAAAGANGEVVPTATGAAVAGIGAPGAAVGAGLGANGAGIGSSGRTGGIRDGAKRTGSDLGANGSGIVAAGSGGIRAGFCTKAAAIAPGCVECAAECARIKAVCIEMEDSFHKRTEHVKQMHYKLSNEIATMKREAGDYRIQLGRMIAGIMVTGTGTLLMLALYFSPYVQRAWQSETIDEVDRRAAARRLEAAQGGAKGEGPGAAPPTSAVVPGVAADQGQKEG